jgi:signal transduction histidine kinase
VKLRTAFVLSLLAVLIVMAVPALYGVRRVADVRKIALDMREQAAEAALIVGRIQAGTERAERYTLAYVATGDEELRARSHAAVRALALDLDRLDHTGYEGAVTTSQFPLNPLQRAVEATDSLMAAGELEEATSFMSTGVRPLMVEANAAAQELAAAIDRSTAEKVADAEHISADAITTTTVAFLLALAVSAGLVLLAARFLTQPLDRLSTAMARVADGRFHPPDDLPYDRADELGELLRSFRSMALRLADLDRMKAEFMGVASHDLKTPVNVITGYAELMEEELGHDLQDRHREILRSLFEQTRTLGYRVNQLMEISRMEASGLRLGLEEINIRHFTAGIERAFAPTAMSHGVRLETLVDPSAPSFVIADPDILREEVVGNLVSNAIRFTPRGGEIRLTVSGHGGTVSFEVRDTGPGIAPDDLPFVFDKYYQGRGLPGRVGAGLGLPIARAGVQAHGGDIEVDCPDEGGTVFRFTLPIHPTFDRPLAV